MWWPVGPQSCKKMAASALGGMSHWFLPCTFGFSYCRLTEAGSYKRKMLEIQKQKHQLKKKFTCSCMAYQLQAKWCLCSFYQAAWCSYVHSASIIPDSWGSVLPKQHSCKSLKAVLHAQTVIHEHTNKKQRGGTIMYALFPEHLLQKTLQTVITAN